MKIFCISGKAQHGKDTTANFMLEALENKGKSVLIFHYADLLKYIAKQYFDWDGNKDEAGRKLLQELGTDVIRKKNPDYWVMFAVGFLRLFIDRWDYVLIPDCRFPNEIDVLKEAGFDVAHIRVERPNFDNSLTFEQRCHPSETALDFVTPDWLVMNAWDLDELKHHVDTELIYYFLKEQLYKDHNVTIMEEPLNG